MQLTLGSISELMLPVGWNVALVILHGTVVVNGNTVAREAQMVLLDSADQSFSIEANTEAVVLLLSGEPIAEPIGSFVMNSQQEIAQAIADFNGGRFGQM